jgi:hypothetical protein
VKTLTKHVAEVRGMYLDTLASWPGTDSTQQEDA